MAGSPIFRRITLTEVKKTSNKRGSLLRELVGLEREEKEIIKNHHDPSYSNWRASFLREEGMTTDGFMQTQLKAEGDTDLETIAGNVEASYQAYEGGSDALSGTGIIASGTGSGTDGGFDLGKDYLSFNGDTAPRYAALKAIDASKFDTIVVTGIRGNDNNGGEDPDIENEDLMIYYQLPGQTTIQRLDVNGGVTQSGIDYKIIPIGSDDSGLQEWSLTLPSYTRAEGVRFILYQPSHSGTGFDNYGITQINYRRVKPISVMVSLDSPEASAFIRVGSPSKATESKKKREQQLREQLEATKDYTDKKFGENFPGSEVAAPGEEDPTEVEKKAPGLGEFEPEVVDYNAWKQDTEKEDPQAKTSKADYTKWKDEKLLKSFANVRDKQLLTPTDQASETPDGKSFDDMKMDQKPRPEPSDSKLASFSTSAKSSTPIGGESGVGAVLGADADNLRRETPPKVPAPQATFEKDFETGSENLEKEAEKGEDQFTMSDKEKEKLKDQGLSDEEIKKDEESQKKSWVDQQKEKVGNFILDKGLEFFKEFDPLDAPVDAVLNLFSGVVNTFNTIGNLVGFTGYEKMVNNIEIMRSNLTGRITSYNLGSTQMKELVDSLTLDKFNTIAGSFEPYKKGAGITYGISDERHEYADDLIKVIDGKISRNDEPGGNRTHQPLANMGTGTSIDGIGKGYGQMIIPKDGGMPYFHYYDYNYLNLNSPDEGEIPGIVNNVGASIANTLRRILPGRLIDDKINQLQGNVDTWGNNLKERVGLDGWPPGVHGATLTDFKIPLDKLPAKTQEMIKKHPLYFDRKVDGLDTDSKEFQDVEMKTFVDAANKNPQKAGEAANKMMEATKAEFPEMVELEERNKVAREEYDENKKVLEKEFKDTRKEISDLKSLNLYLIGNSAKGKEISKVSGVPLTELDKLQKEYDKWKVPGDQYGVRAQQKYAASLPEYQQAQAEIDKGDQEIARINKESDKLFAPIEAMNKRLDPDGDGTLRGTSAEMAEYKKLVDAWRKNTEDTKPFRDVILKQEKIVQDLSYNRDNPKHYHQIWKKIVDIGNEARDKIKEIITQKELEQTQREKDIDTSFEPEQLPPELEAAMRRWMLKFFNTSFQSSMGYPSESWGPQNQAAKLPGGTGPSEDPFSPQLPPPEGYPDPTTDPDAYQDFNVSGGTEVAGAGGSPGQPYTPPKEDPTNPYVPAPGRGTQVAASPDPGPAPVKPGDVPVVPSSPWLPGKAPKVARYKKPDYVPPYVQDWGSLGGGGRKTSPTGGDLKNWDPNAKIRASTQQDFGTLSSFYGGQGVDAATLASTASQTRKKKKKTTVTSSYKPRGSMIIEKRKLKSPNDWFNPDDIKPEHPKDPPPEMVNNYHPDLVDSSKTAERFNKLDPATAKAMPKQDDPNIDAKVEKAKNNPDKDGPGWHKQVSDKIRKARAQQRKGSGYSDDNESNGGNGEG